MDFERFEQVAGKHWSLVRTRPKSEKYTAAQCEDKGITVYLPLLRKLEIHHRGKRELLLPMFPGYFFACPDYAEESVIRSEKGVWSLLVLRGPEEEDLIRDLNLVRQSELFAQKQEIVVNPGLQIGETYRLKSGPFKDQDVVLMRRQDSVNVIVNLAFLGRSIEFLCGADELQN